jgi:hypothetical protein
MEKRRKAVKTKYHYYIERLTGLNWEPNRPLKLYWEHLRRGIKPARLSL